MVGSCSNPPVCTDGVCIQEFQAVYGGIASTTALTVGPDGNIWYTGEFDVGHVSSTGQDLALYYPWPGKAISPGSIAAGPDGNLWVDEGYMPVLGRITPAGSLVETTLSQQIGGLTRGSDNNVWGVLSSGALGRLTSAGAITTFPLLRQDAQAVALTNAADGGFWYADRAAFVGHMTIAGVVREYPIPNGPWQIVAVCGSPDGGAWYPEATGTRIGHVTETGVTSEFPLAPHSPGEITSCAWGADGNLWYTKDWSDSIGRMTPNGQVTEFPGPSQSSLPYRIIAGPGRTLWFTENNSGWIGRITLP